MTRRVIGSAALAALLGFAGCTGGKETSAETFNSESSTDAAESADHVDARKRLGELSPAIPLYAGARYRDDFTRRDSVVMRNQYGAGTEVITLASDDDLPKVWHYYVTYLAQYRAYDPPSPFPPQQKTWRSLEVNLSEAMQDPFVPGTNLKATDRNVILQIAETESAPRTIIRYVITNQSPTRLAALQ